VLTKVAKPTSVTVGGKLTWTITVRNASTVRATDVFVEDVAGKLSLGSALVSVTASQGTCDRSGCKLGTLDAGASATIRVVTKSLKVGTLTNTAHVSSTEADANPIDNSASALVRVAAVLGRVSVAVRCGSLTLNPNRLIAGEPQIVYATLRDRGGRAIAGATLFARGRGTKQHAKTNGRGIARFDLHARKGIVAVTLAGRQLLIRDPRRCTSLLAVRASTAPPTFTG